MYSPCCVLTADSVTAKFFGHKRNNEHYWLPDILQYLLTAIKRRRVAGGVF